MATREKKEARRKRRKEQRRQTKVLHMSNVSSDEVLIYGAIDEWEVSAKSVNDALLSLGNRSEITVRINSGGGDVFEGFAIYNMLASHPATINVVIEGAALSIASVIAMAGDSIAMASNALFMIHDPSSGAYGSSSDMRKQAELLDKAATQIRDTYASRTGLNPDDLQALMQDETWFTAEEALEMGFVTEIIEAKKVAAKFDADKFKVPGRFLELVASGKVASEEPVEDEASPQEEESFMNAELRALCASCGMDAELSDADAQEWFTSNAASIQDKLAKPEPKPEEPKEEPKVESPKADNEIKIEDVASTVADLLDKRDAEKAAAKKAFRNEVSASLELVFGDEVPEKLEAKCYGLDSIEDVRTVIKDFRKSDEMSITFARTQPQDRHVEDVKVALETRVLNAGGASQARIEDVASKSESKGWRDFQSTSLIGLARECLLIDGVDERAIARMSNPDIAKLAFLGSAGMRNEAVHVTGTLGNLTMDAVNKTLLAGYEEAPQTWRGPMRQAASVPDFKDIHRIRLGAVPNLPDWPDNMPAEEAQLADEKVSYAVEARAEKVSFSWRLFVNDDMDALGRIPSLMGDAAARTVNKVAWTQVTGNPTMPYDSAALFAAASGARKRANLITGSATPTTATVGAMKKLMRLMRGLNTPEGNESDDILNLTPKFIVVPAALEQTVAVLVNSSADPADNKSSVVFNTAGSLQMIVEPLLDANSATAWYLFADPARVDTVEVTFLQGQETPQTYDWIDNETLSRNVMIVQTFQAKAIDHRGCVKHAGA